MKGYDFVSVDQCWIEFWAQVEKTENCWLWTGSTDKDGYGHCSPYLGSKLAHRAIMMQDGIDIRGKLVCHTCDIRNCVRREHLYAGTPKSNSGDMVVRQRVGARFGQSHPMAKLTDEQCEYIRNAYDKGVRVADLARELQASRLTVSQIARRKYRNNGTGLRHVGKGQSR